MEIILSIILPAIAAFGLAYYVGNNIILKKKREEILKCAEQDGENIKKEKIFQAKEKFLQLKTEHEQQILEKSNIIILQENRIKQKEISLNQQNQDLLKKNKELDNLKEQLKLQQEMLERKVEEYEKLRQEAIVKIENIAGLSASDARNQLIETMKSEAKSEAMSYISEVMDEARLTASKEAKRIVINTIQRIAPETAIENAVTVFNIESDEIKGRIIGREGRNIRALEAATGVEIVVDDTPEAILLSAFDPVRREVARLALHQLVTDGRIHPARIEEVVAKVQKQLDDEIMETGKRTCIDLGIHGLHPELIRLIGRMKYRSSYGQNLLQHSREVAKCIYTI